MSKLDKLKVEVGANAAESTEGPSNARAEGPPRTAPGRPVKMVGVERLKEAAQIDIERIAPDPDQPRKEFDAVAMEEMRSSLLEHGQLQPIMVYWHDESEKYRIITGERRYRGAILAGLRTLAVVINDRPLTAAEILEIQVVENLVRDDLKPIEKARSIRRLIDEHGYTQRMVATKLKMSQTAVAQALSLLDLVPDVAAKVDEGAITKKAAYELAKLKEPEFQQEVAAQAVDQKLADEQVAEVVKKKRAATATAKGNGGKSKTAKPAKIMSRVHNEGGIKIEARRLKGFDLLELRSALAGFLARVESELAAVA